MDAIAPQAGLRTEGQYKRQRDGLDLRRFVVVPN
jgi:hypothetical protein